MRGARLIQHWNTTQTTVALSSAEAELTGICNGTSQSIGPRPLAANVGIKLQLEIKTDAAAAIGICRRRGLGKVRHLHTADLWIQDKIRTKDVTLSKVLGTANPADILTKHVDRQRLERHLRTLGIREEHGRPDLAPSLDE